MPKNLDKSIKFNALTYYAFSKSVKLTLFVLCIIFSGKNGVQAQNYGFKPTYDKVFYGGMLAFSVTDLYLTQKLNALPHHWEINPLDKLAVNQLNLNYAHAADFTAGATVAISAGIVFFMPKEDKLGYLNQLTQNLWITGNSVQLVKILVQRSRPYTNASGYQFQGNKDDNYSFFSGHSALTASAATTAILYALRNNSSNSLKYTTYGAGILALSTATLRILAGKHYPSDVLTGILFGTGISILNAQIHKFN